MSYQPSAWSPEQEGAGHRVQAGAPDQEDGREAKADGDQGRLQVDLTMVSVAWRGGVRLSHTDNGRSVPDKLELTG